MPVHRKYKLTRRSAHRVPLLPTVIEVPPPPQPPVAGGPLLWTAQKPPAPGLGEMIRRERDRRNWSQGMMATALGTTQSRISAIELGKIRAPNPKFLQRLEILCGWAPGASVQYAGWQGAREVLEQLPPPGSIIIPAEHVSTALISLLNLVLPLPEPVRDQLVEHTQFLAAHWQEGPAEVGGATRSDADPRPGPDDREPRSLREEDPAAAVI